MGFAGLTLAASPLTVAATVHGTTMGISGMNHLLNDDYIVRTRDNSDLDRVQNEMPYLETQGGPNNVGKLHGRIPDRETWTKYSKDDLLQLVENLKKSISKRKDVNIDLGADKIHINRLNQEHQLLKDITKYLGHN